MKLTSLSIIFTLVAVCLIVVINSKTDELLAVLKKKIEYNIILDNAADDAVRNLVEVSVNRELLLNKEEALKNFLNSLYIQFGISEHKQAQDILKIYLPVIAIIYTDGYYILSNEELKTHESVTITEQIWKEKKPYFNEDDKYIYCFSLTDIVKVIDKNTNEIYEGRAKDIREILPLADLLDESIFDTTRKLSIMECLKSDINYYLNKNNKIAEKYGINYEFKLPEISDETWIRTIEDISFIAIFQGYPYGVGGDVYNRVCIAASRISKNSKYYIETQPSDGKIYYHREHCLRITNRDSPYYSGKECASEGAWPCLECN